jgi:hypothetical protein
MAFQRSAAPPWASASAASASASAKRPLEQRDHRPLGRDGPVLRGLAQLLREPCERRQFDVDAGPIGPAPHALQAEVACRECPLDVAGLLGEGEQAVADRHAVVGRVSALGRHP